MSGDDREFSFNDPAPGDPDGEDGPPLPGGWIQLTSERNRRAAEIYAALTSTGRLRTLRPEPLTYWCAARCSLLDVITLPDGAGVILGVPRFKISPGRNDATSSAAGRKNNTEDGRRRWKEHANLLGDVNRLTMLSCDHLHHVFLPDEAIQEDLEARRVEVVVRRDGTRYVVR